MTPIAIVGTGVAGATAALTLRREGFDGRVVLIGDEPDEPYRRPPLSKEYLKGALPEQRLALRPAGSWQKQDIELRTGTRVTAVDPAGRQLTLDDGERLAYHRLLLATGGAPRELPQAAGLDGVYMLRARADVPALRSALKPDGSVLVIGAGLIGAEVAATARSLGCEVTVLEAAPYPLPRLLPPSIAQVYADLHTEQGVALHTGIDLVKLERLAQGLQATDADGRRWLADVVVVAVGMVPRTELAEAAGIEVRNGIVVDECFRSSAPDVFAAGDVANQPNMLLGGRQRVEHWQCAQEQGTAVAKSMLGDRTPYDRVPWCWSDQYGVNLQVAGWPAADDDITVRGVLDDLDFTAIFHRAGRLVGAVGVNRAKDIRALRKLIADAPYAEPAMLTDQDTDLAALDAVALSRSFT